MSMLFALALAALAAAVILLVSSSSRLLVIIATVAAAIQAAMAMGLAWLHLAYIPLRIISADDTPPPQNKGGLEI